MEAPQGSILGPLLFMIFINELTRQCSERSAHLYADDTILGGSAQSLSELWRGPVQGFLRWKLNCFLTRQRNTWVFCAEIVQNSVHAKIKVNCLGISVVRMISEKCYYWFLITNMFTFKLCQVNYIKRDNSEYENLVISDIGIMDNKDLIGFSVDIPSS